MAAEVKIGERSTAAQSVANDAGLFTIALELTDELILITDRQAGVALVNAAFERLTGYAFEEIKGRKAHSLIKVPEDMAQVREAIELLNDGHIWQGVVTLSRKSEKPIELQVSIKPYADPQRGITHFLCSASVPAEDSKSASQGAASHELEAVSHMANGIAHRFNNLLAGILGQSELIKMMAEGNEIIQQRAEKILEVARQGKEVVSQLMVFCKKQEPQYRETELLPIIKNAVKLVEEDASSDIEWRLELPPALPPVKVVPREMHEVILHLLSNAAQSMKASGGILTVQARLGRYVFGGESGDGESVLGVSLIVKDTGTGIKDDVKEHIFEPFFTTHNMAEAMGMGLSIVHGVIRNCGGFVDFESEWGQGSAFEIRLPAVDKPLVDEAPLPMAEGQGERILLVDDEPMITELGQAQLTELGYIVETMNSPEEALERLLEQASAYQLLIVDYTMPTLTGLELVAALRDKDVFIPAVLTHKFSEKKRLAEVSLAHFAGALPKPSAINELADVVRRALD